MKTIISRLVEQKNLDDTMIYVAIVQPKEWYKDQWKRLNSLSNFIPYFFVRESNYLVCTWFFVKKDDGTYLKEGTLTLAICNSFELAEIVYNLDYNILMGIK